MRPMSKPPAKKGNSTGSTIALNRRARHEYFIEDTVEAGLVLMGWEIKSLRAGKANLTDAYVLFKNNEAWLLGVHITPLLQASTHVIADPTRTRKLLLSRREIDDELGRTPRVHLVEPLRERRAHRREPVLLGEVEVAREQAEQRDVEAPLVGEPLLVHRVGRHEQPVRRLEHAGRRGAEHLGHRAVERPGLVPREVT